jgi:hypothetical protein
LRKSSSKGGFDALHGAMRRYVDEAIRVAYHGRDPEDDPVLIPIEEA